MKDKIIYKEWLQSYLSYNQKKIEELKEQNKRSKESGEIKHLKAKLHKTLL